MARSLSVDLRLRVVEAVENGLSRRAAAERFGVSAASAVRWVEEWHKTGRVEALGGEILGALKAKVDVTLDEVAEMLGDRHGVWFARSTIWRFLDRHAMTVKKNGARSRAGQARRRRAARRVDRHAA